MLWWSRPIHAKIKMAHRLVAVSQRGWRIRRFRLIISPYKLALLIMNNTITVRTDTATKKAAKSLADEAGLSLSALVNICLKQAIVDKRIKTYLPEKMTPKMEKIIEEAEREIERGDFSGPFDNYEDAVAYLNKRSS